MRLGTEKARNYRVWQLLIKAHQNLRYNMVRVGSLNRSRYELGGYMRPVEILGAKLAFFTIPVLDETLISAVFRATTAPSVRFWAINRA